MKISTSKLDQWDHKLSMVFGRTLLHAESDALVVTENGELFDNTFMRDSIELRSR